MKEYQNRWDKQLVNPGFTMEEYEKARLIKLNPKYVICGELIVDYEEGTMCKHKYCWDGPGRGKYVR